MKLTNNPNEPQRITLDIVFKVRHEPFNEGHARQLLINHFRAKEYSLAKIRLSYNKTALSGGFFYTGRLSLSSPQT